MYYSIQCYVSISESAVRIGFEVSICPVRLDQVREKNPKVLKTIVHYKT